MSKTRRHLVHLEPGHSHTLLHILSNTIHEDIDINYTLTSV